MCLKVNIRWPPPLTSEITVAHFKYHQKCLQVYHRVPSGLKPRRVFVLGNNSVCHRTAYALLNKFKSDCGRLVCFTGVCFVPNCMAVVCTRRHKGCTVQWPAPLRNRKNKTGTYLQEEEGSAVAGMHCSTLCLEETHTCEDMSVNTHRAHMHTCKKDGNFAHTVSPTMHTK